MSSPPTGVPARDVRRLHLRRSPQRGQVHRGVHVQGSRLVGTDAQRDAPLLPQRPLQLHLLRHGLSGGKSIVIVTRSEDSLFSLHTFYFLQLYLQARMTWRGSKLLRHLLQFVFIMVAWYTALSRVSDYKHHWSDVLAGSLIGSLCALVVVSVSFTSKHFISLYFIVFHLWIPESMTPFAKLSQYVRLICNTSIIFFRATACPRVGSISKQFGHQKSKQSEGKVLRTVTVSAE